MAAGLAVVTALAGCSGSGDDDLADGGGRAFDEAATDTVAGADATGAASETTQAGAAAATTSGAASGGDPSGAASGEAAPDADGSGAGAAAGAGPGAGATTGTTVPPLSPLDAGTYGRDVVYTATVSVEVDDVDAAARQALASVRAAGGILFGQETVSDPEPRTVLIFKVPPAAFPGALDGLAVLGRLLDQTVQADDVTGPLVDLESRIATAEVSVARLRALLDAAADVPTIVGLETELRNRETDLESLRGQLRTLRDQVALATITLTITPAPVPVPAADLSLRQTLAAGEGAPCGEPGRGRAEPTVSVDADSVVTVCYVVVNEGGTALADVTLRDDPLELTTDDLVVVEGSLTAPLPVGGRIVLAGETFADRDVRSAPRVTAEPVDADGEPLGDPVSATSTARVTIDDDGPGFLDALRGSARALLTVLGVLAIVVAVSVPFLWVPLLVGAAVLLVRRHRGRGPATEDSTEEALADLP
jgi:hypothetical protein